MQGAAPNKLPSITITPAVSGGSQGGPHSSQLATNPGVPITQSGSIVTIVDYGTGHVSCYSLSIKTTNQDRQIKRDTWGEVCEGLSRVSVSSSWNQSTLLSWHRDVHPPGSSLPGTQANSRQILYYGDPGDA